MFKATNQNTSKANANRAGLFQQGATAGAFVQPKLNVGKPGDKYEVEADRAADAIVSRGKEASTSTFFKPTNGIQKKNEEQDVIQEKPVAASISSGVQLLFDKDIQEKQEEEIQKEEEETVQGKLQIQKSEEPDTDVEEETLPVQAKTDGHINNESAISSQLNSPNSGSPLSNGVKNEMESGFGTDFSGVKVHTDSQAVQMSQDLGAQAFTHGNDIYFNEGKYDTKSHSGKHLLAHELTHTVQQGASVQPKMIQKTGEDTDVVPVERNFIESEEGSLDLRDQKKEIHIKILDIPGFKKDAGYFPAPPFRLPPREERNTNQRQNWDQHIKNNDSAGLSDKLSALYDKQIPAEVGTGMEPRYYLKVKNAAYNLIGTQTEIKNRVLRPFWDENGNFQFYHVDHQIEIQLGGSGVDLINNYWLLDDKSNIGSGALIKANKDSKLRSILSLAREAENFDVPVPESVDDVRGTDYTITVDEIGSDEKEFEGIKTISIEEATQGKTTEGLDSLTREELLALRGSENEIVIFFNAMGGVSRRVPWNPEGMDSPNTKTDLSDMSGGPVIGDNFRLTSVTYNHGSGGSISGRAFEGNNFIVAQTLTMELQSSPIVEYGGVIPKRSLKSEANKLIAAALSPISFSEVDIIPDKGIYAVGKIRASLPVIENVELDILIDGDEIKIYKTFNTGEFNVPAPFEIHDSSLTVFAGTNGLGIEGQVDFGINNVGEGHIGASASTLGGFELEGAFNFDSELFDPAEISVEYKDDVWTIGGEIGIPEGKVRGVKNATITAEYSEGNFTATGEAELDIPGIEKGTLTVAYGEAGFSISGGFDISSDVPGIQSGHVEARVAKEEGAENYDVFVSGTAVPSIPGIDTELTVTYENGAITISGRASYNRGMLSGHVNIGATNRTIDEDGEPMGEPDDTMRVYGGGDLTLQLTPWLEATAGVQFLPNGEIEVKGRIGLPSTVDIFDRKVMNRNLFSVPTVEIPLFAIPLGPRSLGLVAQINGGLNFEAGFGPGQLREVFAEVTYNPERPDETEIHGHGEFAIPADAGLTLSADLGLGLSVGIASLTGGIELTGKLGLAGEAAAEVDLSWSPQTGVALNAQGRITVNPVFSFGVNALARATLGVGFLSISEEWREELAAFEWGPDIQFGIVFPVNYQEGEPFDISSDDLEVIYPDLDIVDMAKNLATDVKDRIF